MSGSKATAIFKGEVAAGTKIEKRYYLRKPGTIEKIRNRIYAGPTGDLKIYAWLVYGEVYESLLKFADPADPYISGDDDRDEFDLVVPFDRGSYIEVWAVNEDLVNAYDLNLTVGLDYYGGKRRVIG